MNFFANQKFLKIESRKKFFWNVVTPLGIFLLFVFVYYLTSGYIWDTVSTKQDIIFGADTMDTLDNLRKLTFEVDTQKRMLFSVTLTPIAKSIQLALGLSQNKSIRLTLAIMAALNISGVFLFLKKFTASILPSLFFTLFYALCFSNLVIFSIPETYSASNLFILIYMATLLALRKSPPLYSCILLSVVAGIAALFNPVLLALGAIPLGMFFFQGDRKRWALISFANFAIGAFIYIFANYLVFGEVPFRVLNYYANSYAAFNNLIDIKSLAGVFSTFYFFSILSPHPYLTASLVFSDWFGYGNSILSLVAIGFIGILLIVGLYVLFAKKYQKEAFLLTILIWTVLLTLFYTYFNPGEAILYSSQILFPLSIVFLHAFKTIQWKAPLKYTLFSLCFAFMVYNNSVAFLNGVK